MIFHAAGVLPLTPRRGRKPLASGRLATWPVRAGEARGEVQTTEARPRPGQGIRRSRALQKGLSQMFLTTSHSNEASEARWTGLYEAHEVWGLVVADAKLTECCSEGHPEPLAAIAHASALEQAVLVRLAQTLPVGTWGREVLDAAS